MRSFAVLSASWAALCAGEEDAGSDAAHRPVTKVINLLKEMQAQLEKEAEEDQEVYDKVACWCETNDKEKTKAIKDAEASIDALTSKIEELTAMSARLGAEIKATEKEVAANQAALDKANALREKQVAEFNAEEKDLLESISALKAALAVLGKHQGGGFLQIPHSHMLGIATTMQHEMQKHASLLQGVLTPTLKKVAAAFIEAPQDYFDAEPTFKQSYAPQSGQIYGILSQMKDTFESNLATTQKEENENQKAYEEVKAAKEAEIAAGQAQVDSKTQELADADEKNAHAKSDLDDTKASLAADEQYLMTLKETCATTDKEWEERQKTRQLEIGAISQAMAVISGDDAHDLFSRSLSFAQEGIASAQASEKRAEASRILSSAARKLHNPRLANLAVSVKLDAFTQVKAAIDEMIKDLLQEKADEIKHKEFCTDEFNSNQLQTEKKEREKKGLLAKIEDLEMTVKSLTEALDVLHTEINDMQVQMKREGENREKENKDFQTTVADQRETQNLLKAALASLESFYGKQGSAALVQAHGKQEPVGPPPPPGFQGYKKNAKSGGVMALIQQIIDDAKNMEHQAIRAEEDSQKAYEDYVKDTNGSINAKNTEIMNKSEEKAKAEADLVATQETKESVLLELEQLSNYNAELHASCDFTLKNFDVRQTARDQEVEALRQAKAILSGSQFSSFLQGA